MPKGKIQKKTSKARNVKKTQLKQKKSKAQADGDAKMGGVVAKAPRESAHDLFKRHAAERKKVKNEVAELKRQRMKKGKINKDAKKALTKRITDMEEELRKRQEAEQEAAGVEKASKIFGGEGAASDEEGDAKGSDEDSM
mmetsp:Transcript_25946/g.86409  ORF Transcript_25946/g.86409 Transcript_25946/m.86409 type:complete len:140 (+) Transcript_25946:88-507(+)